MQPKLRHGTLRASPRLPEVAMSDLLPSPALFSAFLVASFVLAVTPGPGVFYIVARSVTQGKLSGLASVGGVALGNLGNAIGASLGLAALFAVSSLAFTVVKYVGAAYLIFLGIQALRAPKSDAPDVDVPLEAAALRRIFVDGFVVALLNPKTAIFFAAFLPQFIDTASASMAQTIALGVIFVLLAAVTDSIYALTAGAVRPWLRRAKGIGAAGRYLTGGAFIGLGILTAVSGQKTKT
jgi:threonine/homoserine/homoserine lactone efflux protein